MIEEQDSLWQKIRREISFIRPLTFVFIILLFTIFTFLGVQRCSEKPEDEVVETETTPSITSTAPAAVLPSPNTPTLQSEVSTVVPTLTSTSTVEPAINTPSPTATMTNIPTAVPAINNFEITITITVTQQTPRGIIRGVMWADDNGDQCFDNNEESNAPCKEDLNEPPLENIVVNLVQGSCSSNSIIDVVTTNAKGLYRFDGLENGVYCLSISPVENSNLEDALWTWPINKEDSGSDVIIDFGWQISGQ